MWMPTLPCCVLQGLSDVSWNRESTLLATASDDQTLRLWDAETGQCFRTLEGHTHYVFSCCFSEGGNLLVSCLPCACAWPLGNLAGGDTVLR